MLKLYNTIFAGQKSQFPTANLSFAWFGGYDGNDLLNTKGANPTYVGGTGLDAIYDFSVLNDDRFDKGARVGNSLGLPEYYNDPLNAYFYYDGTNQQTRRYWKLKDFHYYYIQQQTDITPRLLNNWCLLKATATTDTSNEIDTIQELLVYSTEQTGANLTKLRKYIGIQDDFYGDNLIPSASSDFETDGTAWWNKLNCTLMWNSIDKDATTEETSTSTPAIYYGGSLLTLGKKYRAKIDIKSTDNIGKIPRIFLDGTNDMEGNPISSIYQTYQYTGVAIDSRIFFYFRGAGIGTIGSISLVDNIIVQEVFENYYKS